MPPAHSSSVANGVPSGASYLPGSSTSPDTEKIFVPPLFGLPISRYFCGPIASKKGTAAKVSVLLMVVGLPNKPKLAGNGGLKRGSPFCLRWILVAQSPRRRYTRRSRDARAIQMKIQCRECFFRAGPPRALLQAPLQSADIRARFRREYSYSRR